MEQRRCAIQGWLSAVGRYLADLDRRTRARSGSLDHGAGAQQARR
jgi:hypothetical protein